MTDHLLNLSGETSEDLSVSYYLRVISLLEQFSCPDLVIMIAETGLAVAPQHHPERATLAYILFSYHLKLGMVYIVTPAIGQLLPIYQLQSFHGRHLQLIILIG